MLFLQYNSLKEFFIIPHFFSRFKYFFRKSLYSKKILQKVKRLLTFKFYVKSFCNFLNTGVSTTIYQSNNYLNLTSLRRHTLLSTYEMQASVLRFFSVVFFGWLFWYYRIYVEFLILVTFWQYFLLWVSCTENSKLFSFFYLWSLVKTRSVKYAMDQVLLFNILKNTLYNWGKSPYEEREWIINRLPVYQLNKLKVQKLYEKWILGLTFSFFFFFFDFLV